MLLVEIPEVLLDGTQFIRDYLLLKYLKDQPTDCLYFWSSPIHIEPQIWLDTGILSAIPQDLRTYSSQDIHLNLLFTFLNKYTLFGSSLRLLILYEIRSILESWGLVCEIQNGEIYLYSERCTTSYNFYYSDRTYVSCSINFKVLNTKNKVNLLFFKRDLLKNLEGLLTYLNKIEHFGVL